MRLALAIAVISVVFISCADSEEERLRSARDYLASRPEIAPAHRQAILAGRVIVGMTPDEASAAGGDSTFNIQRDTAVWPKEGTDPWKILEAQRSRPDNSKITLYFRNKTQFATQRPVSFSVAFERGRAVRIERGS